jgi:hypothetical protein
MARGEVAVRAIFGLLALLVGADEISVPKPARPLDPR